MAIDNATDNRDPNRDPESYYQFGYQIHEQYSGGNVNAYFILIFAVDQGGARHLKMINRPYAVYDQAQDRARALIHQLTALDFTGEFNPRDIDSGFSLPGVW